MAFLNLFTIKNKHLKKKGKNTQFFSLLFSGCGSFTDHFLCHLYMWNVDVHEDIHTNKKYNFEFIYVYIFFYIFISFIAPLVILYSFRVNTNLISL